MVPLCAAWKRAELISHLCRGRPQSLYTCIQWGSGVVTGIQLVVSACEWNCLMAFREFIFLPMLRILLTVLNKWNCKTLYRLIIDWTRFVALLK